MKNIQEMIEVMVHYQNGGKVSINGCLINAPFETPVWNWNKFNYEIYDEFTDFKRAFSEGALFECNFKITSERKQWGDIVDPNFDSDVANYRIKGWISIEQWDKHKEAIKAYWDGEEIEFYSYSVGIWRDTVDEDGFGTPSWLMEYDYRVKEKIEREMTVAEIEHKLGIHNLKIVKEKK